MSTTPQSAYWLGFREALPFLIVMGPFALLFGVVATEAGLNVLEALGFSVVVIAGAAQFTAIHLMQNDTPVLIVVLSALAVNLRMAMYSASLTPDLGPAPLWQRVFIAYFLVDQSYALASVKFQKRREWGIREKVAYFFGVVTPICPMWYVLTVVGALVGNAIPPEYALDFALPITFIAMVAPMLRSLPHLAAAVVAVTASLLLTWLPLNLGLIASGILGMLAGGQAELWVARQRQESTA